MRRPPTVTEPVDFTSVGWKNGFVGSDGFAAFAPGFWASAFGGWETGRTAGAGCAARSAAMTGIMIGSVPPGQVPAIRRRHGQQVLGLAPRMLCQRHRPAYREGRRGSSFRLARAPLRMP